MKIKNLLFMTIVAFTFENLCVIDNPEYLRFEKRYHKFMDESIKKFKDATETYNKIYERIKDNLNKGKITDFKGARKEVLDALGVLADTKGPIRSEWEALHAAHVAAMKTLDSLIDQVINQVKTLKALDPSERKTKAQEINEMESKIQEIKEMESKIRTMYFASADQFNNLTKQAGDFKYLENELKEEEAQVAKRKQEQKAEEAKKKQEQEAIAAKKRQEQQAAEAKKRQEREAQEAKARQEREAREAKERQEREAQEAKKRKEAEEVKKREDNRRALIQQFAKAGKECGDPKKADNKIVVYDWNGGKFATKVGFSFYHKGKNTNAKVTVTNDGKSIPVKSSTIEGGFFKGGGIIHDAEIDITKPTSMKYEDDQYGSFELTFPTNKTIYITHKEEDKKTIDHYVYPQTGPGDGKFGVTEKCYLQNNNVSLADLNSYKVITPSIKTKTVTYAAQRK